MIPKGATESGPAAFSLSCIARGQEWRIPTEIMVHDGSATLDYGVGAVLIGRRSNWNKYGIRLRRYSKVGERLSTIGHS